MNSMFIIFIVLGCSFAASSGRVVLSRNPSEFSNKERHLQTSNEGKIVGGAEVNPNSLPFQVSIQRKAIINFAHTCGGSVLTENTILTSANCVEGIFDLTTIRVVAAEHQISEDSGLEQIRNVSNYLLHPGYSYVTYENDIALIFLETSLSLSDPSIKSITLPPPTNEFDPPAGITATVSGWGYTSVSSSMSDVLNSVDVTIISDEDCNKAYVTDFNENPVCASMMCAGGLEGGIDACTGDTGGPLFTKDNDGNFIQHGIVSWGRGCALAAFPGVYTQVSYFVDWIAENTM